MAARQGGRIDQDVITAVTAEFLLWDPAGGRTQQGHLGWLTGTVHQLSKVLIWSVPVHLQHGLVRGRDKIVREEQEDGTKKMKGWGKRSARIWSCAVRRFFCCLPRCAMFSSSICRNTEDPSPVFRHTGQLLLTDLTVIKSSCVSLLWELICSRRQCEWWQLSTVLPVLTNEEQICTPEIWCTVLHTCSHYVCMQLYSYTHSSNNQYFSVYMQLLAPAAFVVSHLYVYVWNDYNRVESQSVWSCTSKTNPFKCLISSAPYQAVCFVLFWILTWNKGRALWLIL